jgi:radical SAM superfamily enzyme YgiQ (UPF0313 family)
MKDRILFLVPPVLRFNDFINPDKNIKVKKKNGKVYGNVVTDMPLSVLALSAYVKKYSSVETKLIDFNTILNMSETYKQNSFNNSFEEFFEKTLCDLEYKDFDPTIIGISSIFTPSLQNVIDLTKFCHKIFPNSLIIAGGGVPQNLYKEILKEAPAIDAICFGEGEKPLLSLLKAKDKKKYIEESKSWISHNKTSNGYSFEWDHIENLDEIPFYDYNLSNTSDYSLNPAITALAGVGGHKNKNYYKENYHVMTSRGCPFFCTFCSSHSIHGRKMRYYSEDRAKNDFKRLKEEHGVKVLVFQDDHLMGDPKRAQRLIEYIGKLGLKAVFQNGLALYALKREMLETMKKAGVEQLTLPVESGSERVLNKIMKKPLKLRIVEQVVNDCRELGIYTNVNILIGMPGETKVDIEDSISFLRNIKANWYIILFATPLAGTQMLEWCVENDYLLSSYLDTDFKKAIVETEDFTASYIYKKAYEMNLLLNMVENSDMILGDYNKALIGLENSVKAKNDHALAHYYSGKCYEKLGNSEKAKYSYKKAKGIFDKQTFWREYADMFNIYGDSHNKHSLYSAKGKFERGDEHTLRLYKGPVENKL